MDTVLCVRTGKNLITRVPRQTGQGPTDDSFEKDMNEIKFYFQLFRFPFECVDGADSDLPFPQ